MRIPEHALPPKRLCTTLGSSATGVIPSIAAGWVVPRAFSLESARLATRCNAIVPKVLGTVPSVTLFLCMKNSLLLPSVIGELSVVQQDFGFACVLQ